ncbi:MAG: bifunctional phosphoribosylaminoimidazolecarboxamide formyltransferase/IMP cyclohydrolase PurH [Bacteroidetes bacterium HGW-Bacteroidetes-22]|nr:MAG: bifunctional phosphoribosylaminoimidazolecarboxamide formyltransferase/IMP cyclohydrolase PurH [Bacteroidetes bacterium HGW-Bacteroidetes-22]
MDENRKICTALVSVWDKSGLEPIVRRLHALGVKLISTGGTQEYIRSLGIESIAVESLTGYPAIFGGRVKTLHPAVFGGILYRRDDPVHQAEQYQHNIEPIDLVIVDLYPFEKTMTSTNQEADIIEKIDIGGISLIRAAAKNFRDVLIIPSIADYSVLLDLLNDHQGISTLAQRRMQATKAFAVSSGYDAAIFNYFNRTAQLPFVRINTPDPTPLRYGENPHQLGAFYGSLEEVFEKLHGKELSYNNLLDLDAGISLIRDFNEPTFAILKHNNACGVAVRASALEAWNAALAGDPLSAYGGVVITNVLIDESTAFEINKLFFEIILAPGFEPSAYDLLASKKNRIILKARSFDFSTVQFRSLLNGVLAQDKDMKTEQPADLTVVSNTAPDARETEDMLFANRLVKHSRSNAIVLVKDRQLIGSGVGQTSRVDAVKQAIEKAQRFGFSLQGAVMASDAYFPFADSVQFADEAGITAVIQPGGSIRDNESIEYCNAHKVAMVVTGTRHFRH